MDKRSFLGIFIIGLLFLGILLTVWISQRQTNTSSKASNEQVSFDTIDILTDQLLQSANDYKQALQAAESKTLTPIPSPTQVQIFNSTPSGATISPASSTSSVQGENTSKEMEEKENKMILIAEKRRDLLLQKIETNPQEFLDKATLVDKREQLPEQIKPFIEKRVDAEGLLTLVHIDYFKKNKNEDEYNYLLKQPNIKNQPGNVDYELHFAKNPPKALSGSKIKITKGVGIEQEVVISNGGGGADSSLTVISPAVSTLPAGEQKTAVLLINFSDKPDDKPVALEEMRTKMFGKTSNSVDAYYKDNSFNKVSFSGDVFGWYTIPFNKCSGMGSDYYYWGIAGLKQAINSGIVFDDYRRFIYVFPDSHNCINAGGLGEIGNNYPYPTQSWIFGEPYIDVKVFEHELGHNLGLHHANSISCNDPGDYTHCSQYEYGDVYDIMGNFWELNNSFHFNGPHKLALGWIPEANVNKSVADGLYALAPLETLASRPQILQIPKRDTDEYYFVSYRQKQGFDSNLPDKMTVGASIHIWRPNVNIAYQTNFLKAIYGDPIDVLSDGKIFNDKINQIWIQQTSHDADNVVLRVTFSAIITPTPTPTPTPTTPIPTATPTPKPAMPNISRIEPKKGSVGTNIVIFGSNFNQPSNLLYFYNSQGYQFIDKSGFSQLKDEQALKFTVPDTICKNKSFPATPQPALPIAQGGCSAIETAVGNYKLVFFDWELEKFSNDVDFEVIQIPTPTPTPKPRSIKITYPNGGENFRVGDKIKITWESNKIDKVMLDYSFGRGSLNNITNLIANTGYYDWVVNIGNTSNTKVKIDITGYEIGVGQSIDQSDDYFNVLPKPTPTPTPTSTPTPTPIPSIALLSPNGGETWQVGNTYSIKWQASNITKVIINAIDYTCSSETVKTIAKYVPASQGYYAWTVPSDFLGGNGPRCSSGRVGWKSGDNFKIFVAQLNGDGSYGAQDESNNYLNIVAPPTPTPTPLPLALKIDLRLLGIGIYAGDNQNPLNKNKTVTINLFTDSLYKKSLSATTATVTYDLSNSSFKNTVNLGGIKNGMYYMTIKVDKYITKKTPMFLGGGQSQNRRRPLSIGQLSLTPADLNNDDVINGTDGNILTACLNKTTSACISSSDTNDDGKVNSTDYNLYTKYSGYTK